MWAGKVSYPEAEQGTSVKSPHQWDYRQPCCCSCHSSLRQAGNKNELASPTCSQKHFLSINSVIFYFLISYSRWNGLKVRCENKWKIESRYNRWLYSFSVEPRDFSLGDNDTKKEKLPIWLLQFIFIFTSCFDSHGLLYDQKIFTKLIHKGIIYNWR